MPDLTILTPVAPDHLTRLPLAIASVAAQTVPVAHRVYIDYRRMGPGYGRNYLLEQVTTPYVSFLDADDWLAPTFAASCLEIIRPRTYVYTDWWKDSDAIRVPPYPWCRGSFHLVTAVVATADARAVGGFDEALPGMEDTDFFLKLLARNVCGLHLPVPLVGYRRGGGRAETLHTTGVVETLKSQINARYGRVRMACCNDHEDLPNLPMGEQQPGDILAQARWGGNRHQRGRASGRRYPRMSWPHITWVDPRDVAASPDLWQPAPASAGENGARGVEGLADDLMSQGVLRPAPPARPVRLPDVGPGKAPLPNVRRVQRLAGALHLPTFVAPRQDYPSFRDFWKLADLAGFEVLYVDEVDLNNPRAIYIFSGPEGPPDCRGAKSQTVFWNLEYAGAYTEMPYLNTVQEVWSSDPHHARETGARFVLLGSHKGLNPSLGRADEMIHDVMLLGYQTPRRQAVLERIGEGHLGPAYPGHADSAERHDVLSQTRLMLHVHQHDTAYLAPLRLAIAAAYRLPVISESVPDEGPYAGSVLFADYDKLAPTARLYLEGKLGAGGLMEGMQVFSGDALYQLLCVEHPFGANVIEALGMEVPA